jgi:ribosomal protein L18
MNKFRLSIFKSSKHFYIKVYDDSVVPCKTLIATSSLKLKINKNNIISIKQIVDDFLVLLKEKKIDKLHFKKRTKKNVKQSYIGKVKYVIALLRENNIKI